MRTGIHLVALAAVLASPVLHAQDFALSHARIGGGGITSTGGAFILNGAIGQHEAGTLMSGGVFMLIGGSGAVGGAGEEPPPPGAPEITSHPVSMSAIVGEAASFAVVATGTEPLSFQWRKDGIDIPGETINTIIIGSTVLADAGVYTVVVSNAAGSVTSNPATLTVSAPAIAPAITTHPVSQSVVAGEPASFTVTASGTAPLSYQWKKEGADIPGATGATYNIAITMVGDSGSYTVVVTNTAGGATSNAATLTVTVAPVAPAITTHPSNQTVVAGQPASFTVAATGTTPLSYQWKKGGVDIGGATSATFNIAATVAGDAGSYTCVVTNVAGSATSNGATLTVNVPPSITSHPASQTVVIGGNATFSVTATGTAPFTYQWKRNGVNVGGATSDTLTVSNVQPGGGGTYTVVVTNAAGSVTSNPATLTLDTTPRVINVSCLASAGSGDSTLVIGFFISGTGSKELLIRGVGERLGQAPFNRPNVVADPRISVYNSARVLIDSNDDWDAALAPDFTRVGAFDLVSGSKDAALKITLAPGLYTVHLVNSGATADGLIEVYDLSRDLGSRLTNVSCRLNMKSNETVILGTALIANPVSVLARAVGPGLQPYVSEPPSALLPDPFLRVYVGSNVIATNDNWEAATGAYFGPAGAFPIASGSTDAAIRVTPTPGSLTIHATGKGGAGITIIEIYESP